MPNKYFYNDELHYLHELPSSEREYLAKYAYEQSLPNFTKEELLIICEEVSIDTNYKDTKKDLINKLHSYRHQRSV